MMQFDGINDYVTMGAASGLNSQTFSIGAWIYKTGTGVSVSTGTGGVTAYPIVTKGRGEAETPANLKLNYFMGWRASDNVLVGDFEDSATGLNHPIAGTTTLSLNTWYHVMYVFDNAASQAKLYLNGALEAGPTTMAFSPEPNSIQHFGIGTAINSTGVAAGFWSGFIDDPFKSNGAITDTEAFNLGKSRLKRMPLQIQPSLLKGYWSLDQFANGVTASGASSILDLSGNGHHGTPTNGPLGAAGTLLSY